MTDVRRSEWWEVWSKDRLFVYGYDNHNALGWIEDGEGVAATYGGKDWAKRAIADDGSRSGDEVAFVHVVRRKRGEARRQTLEEVADLFDATINDPAAHEDPIAAFSAGLDRLAKETSR